MNRDNCIAAVYDCSSSGGTFGHLFTDRFTAAVHHFAEVNHIEWVDFRRDERSGDVMANRLAGFTTRRGGVHLCVSDKIWAVSANSVG